MGKNVAIILAGGQGERFKSDIPKQFLKLSGKSVIEHTLDIFEKHPLIDEIYIVVNPQYYSLMIEFLRRGTYKKVTKVLKGGKTRQESSKIGVYACDEATEKVLLHDAIRPFTSHRIISEVIRKLDSYSAVDVAIPTADTIIRISPKERVIADIPHRKSLMRGQTPQGFKLQTIKKAHEFAARDGIVNAVDDCSLILQYRLDPIYVIDGSPYNLKLTYITDFYLAERLFQVRTMNITDSSIGIGQNISHLENKVIVVFGGSRGIGKEICKVAKEKGASVYSFSRGNNVDVAEYRSVRTALKEVHTAHGKIDMVVNTAGILKMGRVESVPMADIDKQIRTNLLGSIIVAKESIPYLRETQGSLTLFTSSSYTHGRENYAAYSCSKAGVVNFAQALSDEVYHYGIRVNVMCPERTNTPMRLENFGKEPEETLLSARAVAFYTLIVALSDLTGQVIDIRKKDERYIPNNDEG